MCVFVVNSVVQVWLCPTYSRVGDLLHTLRHGGSLDVCENLNVYQNCTRFCEPVQIVGDPRADISMVVETW